MNKKIILRTLVISLMTILVVSCITPSAIQTKKTNNVKPLSMDWSDNFDSYENGQILDDFSTGDGGWGGWANNPAAYGTVTNVKSRSSPQSVDINGASDLVHEYSGYTTGIWVYTAWQYIPVDFLGMTYFILMCGYDGGGSGTIWTVQVHFDSELDLVESEFGGQQLPLIQGRWVEISCVIDLDSDWLQIYYDNVLLAEHAWSDTVQGTGGGTPNIAAVDLYANSATTVYYDDISLLPYTPDLSCNAGGPYSCLLEESIDFSGVAHGGTTPYTYLWEFGNGDTSADRNPTYTYPAPGTYTVTLTVTDGVADTAEDQTTATVIGEIPQPDIECSGSLTWTKVKPSATVTGDFQVLNIGEAGSMLNWKVDSYPIWGNWTFTPGSGSLANGSSKTVQVSVIAPSDKKKTFTGTVKIINSDDPDDFCEIDVSLTTPKVITGSILQKILERFPNAFPILRQILNL